MFAFKDFAKFTGKYLCQGLFLNKVAGWGETLAQVFSCEFWNTFFIQDIRRLRRQKLSFKYLNSLCFLHHAKPVSLLLFVGSDSCDSNYLLNFNDRAVIKIEFEIDNFLRKPFQYYNLSGGYDIFSFSDFSLA